jgi:hypothetical protein
MATVTANNYKLLLLKKIIDFSADTFKIILMQKGFSFSRSAHDGYADVSASELATAYGYTAGGNTLAGVTITQDDVNNEATVDWNNTYWTISGGNIEADGAIIYDDTVASPTVDPIIGYIDFGGTILTLDGGTFTIANIQVVNQ